MKTSKKTSFLNFYSEICNRKTEVKCKGLINEKSKSLTLKLRKISMIKEQ